jgi:pimeloyl-ACP methyl ester carboxylesterase
LDNAISLGVKCKAAIGGEYDAGPHMTTATNVRDMISIVAKFTETEDGQSVANPNLVNYWGLSYGTFIGETLAAMFPDRICSVILDGVVDPEDNVTGLGLHSLQFTDDAVSTFFVYCHLAGPSACSYYTGTSAADIFERFEKTFTQLDARHAAAQNLTNAPILEAALESLKEFVSLATYYPIGLFPILSDVLLSFETALSNLTVEALEGIASRSTKLFRLSSVFPLIRRRKSGIQLWLALILMFQRMG